MMTMHPLATRSEATYKNTTCSNSTSPPKSYHSRLQSPLLRVYPYYTTLLTMLYYSFPVQQIAASAHQDALGDLMVPPKETADELPPAPLVFGNANASYHIFKVSSDFLHI